MVAFHCGPLSMKPAWAMRPLSVSIRSALAAGVIAARRAASRASTHACRNAQPKHLRPMSENLICGKLYVRRKMTQARFMTAARSILGMASPAVETVGFVIGLPCGLGYAIPEVLKHAVNHVNT